MAGKKYDTVTVPALSEWASAFFSETATLAEKKAACDAAAKAGATAYEIAEDIGGTAAWNAFVRELKAAGLV